MRKVEVFWKDTYSICEAPWTSREELEKQTNGHMPICSMGYVFKENDDYVVITQSCNPFEKDGGEEFGMSVAIPKGMIDSIRDLS